MGVAVYKLDLRTCIFIKAVVVTPCEEDNGEAYRANKSKVDEDDK